MDVYSCSEWQTLTGNAVMYWHCGMVEEIESPSTTNKGPVTPRRKLANVCTHWHSFPSCFHLTVQNSCLHGPLPSAFQSQTPLPFSVFPAGLLHIYLFFSFCLLILLSPFVLCLLWRELTFTCLQLPEADFLREISFKYYKYSSARSLQSLMWQTCLTTHRTSLNSSLARPIDLGKVLKKCSLWSSSNLTSVSATLLGSPSGKDRWITLQMCLALPKFNLNIWFLKSWSALPTM